MLAAMSAGRSSLGVEIEEALIPLFQAQVQGIVPEANERILERLERHRLFVEDCRRSGRELKHVNRFYDFPVISRQEREILFHHLRSLKGPEDLHWRIDYAKELSLRL
jgi:hypothetical protein